MPTDDSHARDRTRSYERLQSARENAAKTEKYCSSSTRRQIEEVFRERFGSEAREWQVDVSEAILLGLDSVVIAGTGAGKTMPFMMPLLLDSKKKAIILSPLKVLQQDQVKRFQRMKIPSVAVNGDTWNPALKEELEQGRYQAIFASPEMCLKNADFRRILSGSEFNDITAIIVDEAHCISQWGGDFRPSYSEMGKLRAFFPPHIPILATSATLTKEALKEVRSSLSIDADRSFFLNLGNDRINIAFSAHEIKSSTDYEALKPHLLRIAQPTSRTDIDKSIVFVNSKLTTQIVAHVVRSWLPPHLRDCVDFLHALRSERGKRRAMRRFRKGETRILIATEAAGMGADIPDINNVVQFGVPASMAIWIQRAGRAGRSPEIRAHAVLLAEKAMNDKQKKRGTATSSNKPTETQVVLDAESDLEALMDDDTEGIIVDQDGGEDGHYTYKKKVDEGLREWINSKGCRRAIANIYFNNPVSTACEFSFLIDIDGASGHMTEQL